MWEREGESQVDIVDGDNAAEIAGEQRGLMMSLLASERASELSELDRELSLSPSFTLLYRYSYSYPILFSWYCIDPIIPPVSFCESS